VEAQGSAAETDEESMRAVLAGLLAAGACSLAAAPAASASPVAPRSAAAFYDSVGVSTHIVYYDTAYGDWSRIVARLQELGVRHIRDGIYANPTAQWHDWNERYYGAVESVASRGMRFTFVVNPPGVGTGTLDQLLDVAGGRLRNAAEALEAPNEMDKYVGGARWPRALASYERQLHLKAKARPATRSLPILGPSFATLQGPSMVGNLRGLVDVGNIHPYTGGLSPNPAHIKSELKRARITAAGKPVWATEVGFHNAMHSHDASNQAPVSERTAAIYLLRTFFEQFGAGIRRTFAYELIDEKPDPRGRDPEQHFGLLRNDFSRKPAFNALRNLLAVVGRDRRSGRPLPLRIQISRDDRDVRRLVLQKADGSYVVALWRLSSVWDIKRRKALHVASQRITVRLPGAARVSLANPVQSAAEHRIPLRGRRIQLRLGASPVLLHVLPRK
jgi:hypothetical protein